jgi:hypothetical protein
MSFITCIMTTKNYSIYKIFCKSPEVKDIYVGSTTQLNTRIKTHRTTSNNPNNPHSGYKLYKTIKENGGWDNWNYEVIEELENVAKIDARKKEEEWSQKLGATLNTWKAYRDLTTAKTYYERGGEWYKKNQERSLNRYKKMCERLAELEKENAEMKAKLAQIGGLLTKN